MERLRRALRLLSLCTLCVWVAASGVPVAAQIFTPRTTSDDLHAVCSALGIRWVDSHGQEVLPADPTHDPISGDVLNLSGSDHCLRCLLVCAPAVPFRPLSFLAKPTANQHRAAAISLRAPRTAQAWVLAPSRAPPLPA